jgi:hypothetical protein
MAWVFPEVFGSVGHESLAAKEVDSKGNALHVDVLLCATPKVLRLFETV